MPGLGSLGNQRSRAPRRLESGGVSSWSQLSEKCPRLSSALLEDPGARGAAAGARRGNVLSGRLAVSDAVRLNRSEAQRTSLGGRSLGCVNGTVYSIPSLGWVHLAQQDGALCMCGSCLGSGTLWFWTCVCVCVCVCVCGRAPLVQSRSSCWSHSQRDLSTALFFFLWRSKDTQSIEVDRGGDAVRGNEFTSRTTMQNGFRPAQKIAILSKIRPGSLVVLPLSVGFRCSNQREMVPCPLGLATAM